MNYELIHTVKEKFQAEFEGEALMVFSPGRINLIGEHTDYNNGFVFPAAIDKGIALMISKSENAHSTIVSVDMKETLEVDLKNLNRIEAPTWKNYIIGVIAELMKVNPNITNFNCVFKGDIPVGSGLSSSAALENSLVFGLNELFQLGLSKMELIHVSQKAEHNYVGVKCGIMDQFASMFGVEDHALFLDCESLQSEPVFIDLNAYDILLVNSNVKHALAESAYNERYEVCHKIAHQLNKLSLRDVTFEELETLKSKISNADYQKGLYVLEENDRVVECKKLLKQNDIEQVGQLLYLSHHGQSTMYQVSCKELDFLIEEAKQMNYVVGARMVGGGFGGCTINLVLKSNSEEFQKSISNLYQRKFDRTCSIHKVKLSDGTRVVKM
ncbi:galactokinase [Winogradskyella tangerina]|uniref:galactokinase n=1 Tax=Winogradskyella tangerina TaxID=2023240 RepID=UPI000DBE2A40|nr:galactokinase [Winogradskyella tangerina]